MMISRVLLSLCCLILLVVLLSTPWHSPLQKPHSNDPRNRVVATVGPRSITLGQAEQTVALPLYQADQQRTTLLRKALEELIDEELLAAEAARKGVTVPQLLEDASQSEAIARLANLPAPVKRLDHAKAPGKQDHEAQRDPQEQARVRQALLVSLRRRSDIHITLPEPEIPVLPVSADDDPWIGAANASVTIVEFSDFQCPYCKLSVPVIKEVLEKYPDTVKVVYRDFPSPNHTYAQQAAEAAQCAGEQGKFWEYHDLLFSQQVPGKGWDFATLAKQLGFDYLAFSACLDSDRYRGEVIKDFRDGVKLGLTGTPTFFVNGRPLVGAHAFADFKALIDPLLQQ